MNMNNVSEKIYCSVDLELSGFDPGKAEILEVGLCFFTPKKGKLVVLEEWSSTFKPKAPVSATILGLTGLSQKLLDESPLFSEHRDELTEKLKDAVIIGHNVVLDIRFLEAFGVKLSGEKIDTMDLVQVFLPTHHSYNLENLMHSFKISHKDAHRALADARANVFVLEKLLGVYGGFSSKLQKDIYSYANKANFDWAESLKWGIKKELAPKVKHKKLEKALKVAKEDKESSIISFPYKKDALKEVVNLATLSKTPRVLALPDKRHVMHLIHAGIGEGVFQASDAFDEKRFKTFVKKKDKSAEELRFMMKIMVWKETNNQTRTVRDLNVNFAGGQFIQSITSKKVSITNGKLLVLDHATLLDSYKNKILDNRYLILWDIEHFERSILKTVGSKVSWGQIIYSFKSIYNPETGYGDEKYSKEVIEGLASTDLFFGVVMLNLKNKISDETSIGMGEIEDYNFKKIVLASKNFVSKIQKLQKVLRSKDIERVVKNLEKFFKDESGVVKWFDIGENYCAMVSRPLSIEQQATKVLSKFKLVKIVDTEMPIEVMEMYKKRLGITDFKSIYKNSDEYSTLSIVDGSETLEKVLEKCPLPAAVLFSNGGKVKRFYEQSYVELKKRANLLAQNVTGGTTKLIRNFSIRKESILMATSQFVLDNSWARIEVATLFLEEKSSLRKSHPYFKELVKYFSNLKINYEEVLLKDRNRLVIRTFYSKSLKSVKGFK